MPAIFDILIPIALGAVLLVLLMGLFNMMRGGNANLSQKLMRWRVGLQFVAVVVVMTAVWLKGGAG
ncbi:twin transmembrane helix small protein [Methylobrevis pamukkalensis]|nr:twin transmembrane helix small protein [Methylobrevis pamukkalensis]